MNNLKINALQIDLARQKENLPYIFSYIDFAKKNGYNTLLIYLENAIRTESTSFFNTDDTYSMEEIKEIVDYADSKGIDVIPALETLDHLEKFFTYPQFLRYSEKDCSVLGRSFSTTSTCGCLSSEGFYDFIDTYVTEVSALFKSEYFHVGLDETFDFTACYACQERIKNGESAKDMFLGHILHMHKLLKNLGKRMMMWDDFFEFFDVVHDLPTDIVMCTWNYSFMSDQPLGHWINRNTKNWFALYDQLGIEYMFCTYPSATSSTYTIDSYYDYASRYKPMGALMTAWEKASCFYTSSYPCMAYAGRLFSGQITKDDKIAVYTEILDGNKELAELLASINVPHSGWYGDITKICESDYLVKYINRNLYAYILPKFENCINNMIDGLAKDIAIDAYNHFISHYQILIMQKCAIDYFEGRDRQSILDRITSCKKVYAEIKERYDVLWKKYRSGIKSFNDSYESQYKSLAQRFDNLYNAVKEDKEFGILYVELMLPEAYSSPRNIIRVVYEDGEEQTVFEGSIKPTTVSVDFGGCFTYRFAIKPKKIKELKFTAMGEGGTYPTYFRYSIGKEIFVIDTVKKVEGYVINEHKLLRNDCRFAEMGYDDGVAHVADITLCKVPHTISMTFKKFE